MDLKALATDAKRKRVLLEQAKLKHFAGVATYDELADAGKAFARAFYDYQVARFGKRRARLPDYRAVIR